MTSLETLIDRSAAPWKNPGNGDPGLSNVFRINGVFVLLLGLIALFTLADKSPETVSLMIPDARAGSSNSVRHIAPPDVHRVRRNYRHHSVFLHDGYAISIDGTTEQIQRMADWLDRIYLVPIGRMTIDNIMESRNRVVLRHSPWALHAAGRTSAPISSHLTDGIGEDVVILFDARIPESGSHRVFNAQREPIEFNVLQNLFNELVHARHLTNGTCRYFDSEGQAIEEENIFRSELAHQSGDLSPGLRVGVRGQQFWWPASNRTPD